MRLMGLEEGEEEKVVARGKVVNIAGASLHGTWKNHIPRSGVRRGDQKPR